MKEYELAIEYPSFFPKKIINRVFYKVRFKASYNKVRFYDRGTPTGRGFYKRNTIIVDPSIIYEEFKERVLEHISKKYLVIKEHINLKWRVRPPMIPDVIQFEWSLKTPKTTYT